MADRADLDRPRVDLVLFGVAMLLVAVGLVAISSASYPRAGGTFAHALRQLAWIGVGLIVMVLAFAMPSSTLRSDRTLAVVLVLSLLLLLACYLPGLSSQQGRGTARWISFLGISIQPSEPAKFALMLILAHILARVRGKIRRPDCLVRVLLVIGLFAALILKQPHLGCTLVICGASLLVLFIAGARPAHLATLIAAGAIVVVFSLVRHPYQMARIEAWARPSLADPSDETYQAIHCATALARGGLVGRGPGRSIEKFDYLPECYTDSILAVFGEEFGFLGTSLLLVLYLVYGWRGMRIAMQLELVAQDRFGALLACGLTCVVMLQALLNYWVTSGLLPQTGVGLPFISYGGSALCCFLGATGLLLHLSLHTGAPADAGAAR